MKGGNNEHTCTTQVSELRYEVLGFSVPHIALLGLETSHLISSLL